MAKWMRSRMRAAWLVVLWLLWSVQLFLSSPAVRHSAATVQSTKMSSVAMIVSSSFSWTLSVSGCCVEKSCCSCDDEGAPAPRMSVRDRLRKDPSSSCWWEDAAAVGSVDCAASCLDIEDEEGNLWEGVRVTRWWRVWLCSPSWLSVVSWKNW